MIDSNLQPKFRQAVKEGTKTLLMKPSGEKYEEVTISAEILECRSDVFIKIINELSFFQKIYTNHPFDITFILNRITFQMQHNVLKWIKEHSPLTLLINGPRFHTDPETRADFEYPFS